jgi:hypothetical protein
VYYYRPAFYAWAFDLWPAPVSYGWGWAAVPWYPYYAWYFEPYPVYPGAAFWLTDYVIAANLQAAYAAQAATTTATSTQTQGNAAVAGEGGGQTSPASRSTPVVLSPEVKQAIEEEVKAQLAAEKAATGSSGPQPTSARDDVPPALDPAHRTFIVSSDLDEISEGQECTLTPGDVIVRLGDIPDADKKVPVSVSASKRTDCSAGKQLAVSVDDLQEMHNHFQEQIDAGLKTLAARQGTGGLPKAPDTSATPGEIPPPTADTTAARALTDQQAAADETEARVVKEAFNQGT